MALLGNWRSHFAYSWFVRDSWHLYLLNPPQDSVTFFIADQTAELLAVQSKHSFYLDCR
jgi:hypothetical protein